MNCRILLVMVIAMSIAAAPAAAQCDLTEGFLNAVTVTADGFEVVFASDQGVYPLDGTVRFELIVKNVGAAAATLLWPVETPDAIFVAPPDCTVIQECGDQWVFSWPNWLFYVPGQLTLEPGACHKWTATWDLTAEPAPAGTYQAWGGLFAWETQYAWLVGEWILPAEGAHLAIVLEEPVDTTPLSLDGLKAQFR